MPALVKTLHKKDKSSKSTASGLAKSVAKTTVTRKRKHEAKDGVEDEDEVEEKEVVQKKAKKLRGKEKENSRNVDVKAKQKAEKPKRVPVRSAKTDEKAPKPIANGNKKETASEKVLVTKVSKKGAESESKKRKKMPTPSPEPSEVDSDESEGDEGEGADDVEDASEIAAESTDDDEKDPEEEQSEAGSGSDSDEESANRNDKRAADEDEEAPLHGFTSGSDSSDDEEVDKAPIDVGKLPTVAKDDVTVKRKLEKAKKQRTEQRGVIYLGRIPHGFYEDQMKAYFSQFGDVTRLRLSRNKKTGRSKHYAFVEFKSSAVAQIVAETMDNYLLMGHLLQCKFIPKEEVHPELWIGSNRRFRKVPTTRLERLQQNKSRTDAQRKGVERRLLKRQEQKKRKLETLGIDYDMGPVSYNKNKKGV